VKALLRDGLDKLARRAARSYIVGAELPNAIQAARFLAPQSIASTICYWDGEADDSRQVANHYLSIVEAIRNERLDCYLSVKPWALQFSDELFDELCRSARQHDVRLHFDSLLPDVTEQTFALIERPTAQGLRIGCTLPARWSRSVRDVERAIESHLRVRIVKGQWPDPDGTDLDAREGFLKIVDQLGGRIGQVAVATHDPGLARESLTRLRAAGTQSELELLFGLPVGPCIAVAQSLGVPVRVYLPFGRAWLPYVLAQAKRNPRVAWWIFRDLCTSLRSSLMGSRPTHFRLPL
jgi:proline dehydrogenase